MDLALAGELNGSQAVSTVSLNTASQGPLAHGVNNLGRPEVAVVDDDARIRVLLEDELHAHGLVSHLCSGIAELSSLLQHRCPQLVLLGVRGSDPALLEDLSAIRASGCHAPLVVLNTAEDEGFAQQLTAAGAAQVLPKHQLLTRLSELLHLQLGVAVQPDR